MDYHALTRAELIANLESLGRRYEDEKALRLQLEAVDRAVTQVEETLDPVSPDGNLDDTLRIVVTQARMIGDAEYAAIGIGGEADGPFER